MNDFFKACINQNTDIIDNFIHDVIKYKPDDDGRYGLHLYYKYGGKNHKYLQDETTLLLDINMIPVAYYFLDNIELLNDYIKLIKKKKFLIKLFNKQFFKKLIQFTSKEYYKIILFFTEYEPIYIINYIIKYNEYELFKYIYKHMPNKIEDQLVLIINMKRLEMLKLITKNNCEILRIPNDIYDNRGINEIFYVFNDDMVKYLINTCLKKIINNDKNFIYDYDNFKNSYLHIFLYQYKKIKKYNLFNELKIMIEMFDLNIENYEGITCGHLLFQSDLWLNDTIYNTLKNRKINLLKTNNYNQNIYEIIEIHHKTNQNKFNELSEYIHFDLSDNLELNKNIKNIVYDIDIKIKNYGLFGSKLTDYMFYIEYLKTKYSKLLIPIYDDDKDNYREFVIKNMIVNKMDYIKNRSINLYSKYFTKYLVHNIFWIDENNYFLHDKLFSLIQNTKKLFVLIKITFITSNMNHANILLYDKKREHVYRFEPYGVNNLGNDGHILDNILKNKFKKINNKIKYYQPQDYLNNLNFQLLDGEDTEIFKSYGDPEGYCLAWSIWFIDFYLMNCESEINFVDIIKYFMNRENIMRLFKQHNHLSDNYYFDFIRSYAHHLTEKKISILKKIKIDYKYYYRIHYNKTILQAIKNYFINS
jgi:hypothetical protein